MYNPQELNEILSLIEDNLGSVNMDPLVRAGRLVKVLHDNNYKIVKLNEKPTITQEQADQLKDSIESKYGKL